MRSLQYMAAKLVGCSFEPRKKDLMISKIIGRAACLAELTSNPKSFFNCPDLHGGSGLPEGRFRSGEIRLLDPAGNVEETQPTAPAEASL